jgi:hypothetical protein
MKNARSKLFFIESGKKTTRSRNRDHEPTSNLLRCSSCDFCVRQDFFFLRLSAIIKVPMRCESDRYAREMCLDPRYSSFSCSKKPENASSFAISVNVIGIFRLSCRDLSSLFSGLAGFSLCFIDKLSPKSTGEKQTNSAAREIQSLCCVFEVGTYFRVDFRDCFCVKNTRKLQQILPPPFEQPSLKHDNIFAQVNLLQSEEEHVSFFA